jgi:hypothetical protein
VGPDPVILGDGEAGRPVDGRVPRVDAARVEQVKREPRAEVSGDLVAWSKQWQ